MEAVFEEDKTFDSINYTITPLAKGDYENCDFLNCDFSNTDLGKIKFTECRFTGCNLSAAGITGAAFRNIIFKGCKLLGLQFDTCNDMLFEVRFEHCIVNLSVFYKRRLKNTRFSNCTLIEVDFSEADLSNSVFDNCDLSGAVFDNTILEKTDFTTAYNYSIDPEKNPIKKAKFCIPAVIGLLNKYDIEII
jgi:uncharacterized protein YjbI with pentapeptide repeats